MLPDESCLANYPVIFYSPGFTLPMSIFVSCDDTQVERSNPDLWWAWLFSGENIACCSGLIGCCAVVKLGFDRDVWFEVLCLEWINC